MVVTTAAENKLSNHSIEPPPKNRKNKVLTINTVIDETKVDLITELKETPNALIIGKKLLAKVLRNENSQLFFVLIN